MAEGRKDDTDSIKRWFRSGSRVFVNGGLWYFHTREGTVEGPYADKYSAEKILESYIQVMRSNFVPTGEFSLVEDGAPGASAPRSVQTPDLGIGRISSSR
jgi:Domain of unknown function (DUF6316)